MKKGKPGARPGFEVLQRLLPLLLRAKRASARTAGTYSAAISSASPSWRIISSSRSAASNSALTSCLTRSAASSSSGESWTLR